jgi:hypothetical protein
VFRLQREVLQEKTKVKALSEELENPMNIHRYGTASDRWAKRMHTDPFSFEDDQTRDYNSKR